MPKKKKKSNAPKENKANGNKNGQDTEKEICENPPYSDIRPRKLKEPVDQPEGPDNEETI